jgi:hypothetical protein
MAENVREILYFWGRVSCGFGDWFQDFWDSGWRAAPVSEMGDCLVGGRSVFRRLVGVPLWGFPASRPVVPSSGFYCCCCCYVIDF